MDYVKEALDIVKAQAGVRSMTEEEITTMVRSLASTLGEGDMRQEIEADSPVLCCDPKKAIKEKVVVCLECGKSFSILSKKHLASHNLTAAEYREKYGYKKGMALACKALVRARRKNMAEMKLWERRGNKAVTAGTAE